MNEVEVFNEYKEDIKEIDDMKDFINYCIDKLNLKNVMFNVIIVDNEKIHMINKEYRKIDRPTDVISFALEDDKTIVNDDVRVLGDIYISYDKVKEQANDYGHSVKREMCFLFVHGLLHLLGYDHMNEEDEKVMFQKQDEILNYFSITRKEVSM